MKTKSSGLGAALIRLLAPPTGLLLCQNLLAAVTFTNTPSAVSNTYAGTITLQIGGLTNKTVVVQKFLDLNTNGVIDGTDWLVQQFTLQDGTNFVIGGVTNFNVPGDLNATTGAITATLNFQNGDFVQNIVGKYLYKLSSPGGHFEPLTNQFAVTNFPFLQKFTGNVVSNATSTVVSNASVMLFPPPRPGKSGPGGSPVAGVVADNAGSYTVQAPPGTYMLAAFRSNYLASWATAPVVILGSGATVTTNLTLTNATQNISGKVVDTNNQTIGLPGVMVSAQGTNGLFAVTTTDTNGNFYLRVQSGQWSVKADDTSLIVHGYLGLQNRTNVNTGATGVTIAVPKATALIYGSVKDNLGNPLTALDVYANDQNYSLYQTDGYTDANGNYVLGVLGLGANDYWWMQANSDNQLTNYVFTQETINGNINAGQAVLQNFTAILATNHITGNVTVNGTNAVGVWVSANANINGTNFQTGVDTDSSGNYWLNVANSNTWTVSVQTGGGDYSLPGGYLCGSQTVGITNNNPVVNFTAILATNHITGHVQTGNSNSIPGVGVWASATISNSDYHTIAGTDSGGNYSLNVINGNWTVSVLCSGGPGGDMNNLNNILGPGTYQCPDNQTAVINNNNATNNFTVQLCSGVQILTTNLPDGQVSIYYDVLLSGSSCVGNLTWSLNDPEDFPPDLSFDSSGEIYGTPTDTGTYNFTVHVDDGNGHTTNQDLSLTITAAPVDVLVYYVMKLEAFLQTSTTNVVPDTNHGPFNAYLCIVQSDLDTVPIANVYLPSGAIRGFPSGLSDIKLQVHDTYASQAALDAVYTNGDYTFAMATMDNGFQFPVLTMPVVVYPAAPLVSNFAAAQAVTPTSPFTLQWSNPPDATTNDTIWVFILDHNGATIFSTPNPATNSSIALRGNATSVVVPTNTFQLGGNYAGVIIFTRATSVNTTAYPGAVGLTLVSVQTVFFLAAPSGVPVLSQPARGSVTQFDFLLTGITGQNYTILASTNVALPMSNWFTVLTTNLSGSPAFIQDNHATNDRRFYRVLVGP